MISLGLQNKNQDNVTVLVLLFICDNYKSKFIPKGYTVFRSFMIKLLDATVCISYFFEDAYFEVFDIVSWRIKVSCYWFIDAVRSYVA